MSLESCRFFRRFMVDPRAIGALTPATRFLSRSVAAATLEAHRQHQKRSPERLKLIELGAGTGALSRSLRSLAPILVERDESWARGLRVEFPLLEVRSECATQTLRNLEEPIGLVTSIPLLNNPMSDEIRDLVSTRYAEGLIKFCVLYTYGWSNPLAGTAFREARRASFVPRSLPPAHVWLYQ